MVDDERRKPGSVVWIRVSPKALSLCLCPAVNNCGLMMMMVDVEDSPDQIGSKNHNLVTSIYTSIYALLKVWFVCSKLEKIRGSFSKILRCFYDIPYALSWSLNAPFRINFWRQMSGLN